MAHDMETKWPFISFMIPRHSEAIEILSVDHLQIRSMCCGLPELYQIDGPLNLGK